MGLQRKVQGEPQPWLPDSAENTEVPQGKASVHAGR